ncbi:hypothetical protein [Actinokineospora sp. NBRC 105648]|uniref:hypothetical protein n=1 Tax=Actinokineospora sp. NBRC 105648 TaxID=3032206 RepID=UPI0024A1A1EC|nr:hypothetical protein [Actinokineospora sp. NBRC 105648]GLZ37963.1 hypothetical protein Acsp05_15870 [Actinokineospora sp. NBRC 105648]
MSVPWRGDLPEPTPAATKELARVVFSPVERWGWEYAPAPAPVEGPDEPQPVWKEPASLVRARAFRRARLRALPVLATGVGVATALGDLAVGGVLAGGVFLAGMSVVVARQWLVPRARLAEGLRDRAERVDRFERRQREWAWQRAQRDADRARQDQADEWFPLRPISGTTRVDVFGGTGAGWAGLITTVGGSVLRSGGNVLVVDFSEQRVAAGLVGLARQVGVPAADLTLTHDPVGGSLLQGLSPADVAQVVAGAVATMRSASEASDLRIVDADVLKTVAECLDGPITFARLAAALRLVRGHDYAGTTAELLDLTEAGRLTGRIGLVGTTERVANALQTLTYLTELLHVDEAAHADTAAPLTWAVSGLTVLTSAGPHPDRKDFLDRLLFQRILHALRANPRRGERDVVFVANADHIGVEGLEALAKHARRVGVRLVLLLEHLRGDLTRLLGGVGSATILMRMGNPEEAKAAAEFIGREHTFVLNQVTDQVGTSLTEGNSENWGNQNSTSSNEGTHLNKPKNASVFDRKAGSTGESAGTATSRTNSWGYAVTESYTDTENTSTAVSRVYEYTVEPTRVQGLPPTAFILVETGPDGRRVTMGDCDPGIPLRPRVAITPRRG